MRILLDTQIVLRAMQDARTLSSVARRPLRDAEAVFVSAASLWEIAVKAQLGKLDVDSRALEAALDAAGFQRLAIHWTHASKVRELPPLHRDPFDRMLIAQALSEPLRVLTHDKTLLAYTDLVTLV